MDIENGRSTDENEIIEKREDRDLGFGAVVASQSTLRLLNRDGSFNVERHGLGWRSKLSLYLGKRSSGGSSRLNSGRRSFGRSRGQGSTA